MRQGSALLLHTSPAMAKVAPPLLAARSCTAITAQPSSRKGTAGLFRSRIGSKRTRITAKLGMITTIFSSSVSSVRWGSLKRDKIGQKLIHAGGDGELKPPGKKKFITREEEPEQ